MTSRAASAAPWGRPRCSRRRPPGAARRAPRRAVRAPWKTTVNDPSGRSPNASSSSCRTRSESVPGTAKVFDRSGESREHAKPPARQHTAQTPSTGARWRSTKRVHRGHGMTTVSGSGTGRGPMAANGDIGTSSGGDRGALRRPLAGSALLGPPARVPAERRQLPHRRAARADRGRRASGRRPRRASPIVVGERTLVDLAASACGRGATARVYQQMEIEYGPFQRQVRAARGRRPRAGAGPRTSAAS